MDIENVIGSLKVMAAQNAQGVATQGTSGQRLALLAQAGVAPGTTVIDTVTGQPVQVVSVAVAYLPTGVIDGLQ
jgi:hypothetical protein